jgi:hypothetical protein
MNNLIDSKPTSSVDGWYSNLLETQKREAFYFFALKISNWSSWIEVSNARWFHCSDKTKHKLRSSSLDEWTRSFKKKMVNIKKNSNFMLSQKNDLNSFNLPQDFNGLFKAQQRQLNSSSKSILTTKWYKTVFHTTSTSKRKTKFSFLIKNR